MIVDFMVYKGPKSQIKRFPFPQANYNLLLNETLI